jgi:signal transduction histidine kinase
MNTATLFILSFSFQFSLAFFCTLWIHRVSMPVKIALCRILQESLSNVRRHAGVENASVKLWVEKENLVLEVADQGRGFEPPPLSGPHATERQEHIGLRGMRERAALVGGKLFVESQPGAGTCVRVEVPLHE